MTNRKGVSILAAWALAFGCALGWDVFVLPRTQFLPMAGWLGTIIGIVAGGIVMGLIAWNYSYMINRHPGPGGVYAYASDVFGCDHGFICAWFICLAYAAIVWADAMALGMVVHYIIGNAFHSGIGYNVAGHRVCLNCIMLAVAVTGLVAALCCRRRLSFRLQTVLALCLALGIIVCFGAMCVRQAGDFKSFGPAFAPNGQMPFAQILGVFALSPWLFIGIETISCVSDEFRFKPRKSFAVMASALGAAIAGYALLLLILSANTDESGIALTEGPDVWRTAIYHAFDTLRGILGSFGSTVLSVALAGALMTNLIGNMIASASLLSAMADDGAMPSWFARKNADGAPRNAILAVAGVILFTAPLGQAVIVVVVDIALVGAVVAYAYVSAATWRLARTEGNRLNAVLGMVGLVLSVATVILFLLPGFATGSAESYLVILVWCLAGLLAFLSVFRRDSRLRFGRSPVVWLSLLAVILAVSVVWVRQSTYDITAKAYNGVYTAHSQVCHPDAIDGLPVQCNMELRKILDASQDAVTRDIMRNNIVQTAITVLAIVLMVALHVILRRREKRLEWEKTRAKNYFFSTVSHDIRTPLNAVIGFTEMLRDGMDTEEERRQALDAIEFSGKTLLVLVNDILDLSKLESGKMTIASEPTDCEAIFRGIMDVFKISAGNKEVEYRCRVRPMPKLMVDPLRIRQIAFNLVGNASKFTKRGHVILHASYEVMPGDETGVLRFMVEDTGCGISEADLARIDGAYVQTDTRASRNGGTGLGLAICRNLAKAMGGKLSMSSVLGAGSKFSVEIPGVRAASDEGKPPKPESRG